MRLHLQTRWSCPDWVYGNQAEKAAEKPAPAAEPAKSKPEPARAPVAADEEDDVDIGWPQSPPNDSRVDLYYLVLVIFSSHRNLFGSLWWSVSDRGLADDIWAGMPLHASVHCGWARLFALVHSGRALAPIFVLSSRPGTFDGSCCPASAGHRSPRMRWHWFFRVSSGGVGIRVLCPGLSIVAYGCLWVCFRGDWLCPSWRFSMSHLARPVSETSSCFGRWRAILDMQEQPTAYTARRQKSSAGWKRLP